MVSRVFGTFAAEARGAITKNSLSPLEACASHDLKQAVVRRLTAAEMFAAQRI